MRIVTYAPLIGVFFTGLYGGITTWLDVKTAKEKQDKLQFFVEEYDKDLEKVYGQFNLIQQELGKMKLLIEMEEKEVAVLEDDVEVVEDDVEELQGHVKKITPKPEHVPQTEQVFEPIQRNGINQLQEIYQQKK